jgi:hypothetical protein
MTPEERAEKIVKIFMGYEVKQASFYDQVLAEIREAVEEALAQRDLEQFGEAFVLNGKRIGPNEIYKSTADYVKEAKAEAYQDAAKIAESGPTPGSIVQVDGDVRDPAALVSGYQKWIANKIHARAKEIEGT